MPIKFACEHCGKSYTVSDKLAGKKAKCKKCGQAMRVPALADDNVPKLVDDEPSPPKRRKRSVQQTKNTEDNRDAALHEAQQASPVAQAPSNEPAQDQTDDEWSSLIDEVEDSSVGYELQEMTPDEVRQHAFRASNDSVTSSSQETSNVSSAPSSFYASMPRTTSSRGVRRWSPSALPAADTVQSVLILGVGLFLVISIGKLIKTAFDSPRPGFVLGMGAIGLFVLFAVLVPLGVAAIWTSGRIFKFELPDDSYVRVLAAIHIPGLLSEVLQWMGGVGAGRAGTGLGVILIFFGIWLLFNLKFHEVLVSYILMGVYKTVALIVVGMVVGAVFGASLLSLKSPPTPSGDQSAAPTPSIAQTPSAQRLQTEEAKRPPSQMPSSGNKTDSAKRFDDALQGLHESAQAIIRKGKRVGTWQIPESIYEPLPAATEELSINPDERSMLGPPFIVGDYVVSTPPGMKFELRYLSARNRQVAAFSWLGEKEGYTRPSFAVGVFPATDPRQQRPWFRPVIQLGYGEVKLDRKVLHYDYFVGAAESVVKMAGFTWLRVVDHDPGTAVPNYKRLRDEIYAYYPKKPRTDPKPYEQVWYVRREGNNWVMILYTTRTNDPQQRDAFELAARSIRPRRAGDESLPPFNLRFLLDQSGQNRKSAASWLCAMGPDGEAAALNHLQSGNTDQRYISAGALASIGNDRAYLALRSSWLPESDPVVRQHIQELLEKRWPGRFDDVERGLLYMSSLQSKHIEDWGVKITYAEVDNRQALVDKHLALVLSRCRQSDSGRVLQALAKWGTKASVPALLSFVEKDGAPRPRGAAIRLLGDLRATEAIPAFARWLHTNGVDVGVAMQNYGSEAENALIELLSDEDDRVQEFACRQLAKKGTKKSLRPLSILARVGSANRRRSRSNTQRRSRRGSSKGSTKHRFAPARAKSAISDIKKRRSTSPPERESTPTKPTTIMAKNWEEHLGEPMVLDGYTIRAPLSFQLESSECTDTRLVWRGDEKASVAPRLILSVTPRGRHAVAPFTLLPRLVTLDKRPSGFPADRLFILGARQGVRWRGAFRFARAYRSPSPREPGRTVLYATFDAHRMIIIRFEGVEDNSDALTLMEASADTINLATPLENVEYPIADAPGNDPPPKQVQTTPGGMPLAPYMRNEPTQREATKTQQTPKQDQIKINLPGASPIIPDLRRGPEDDERERHRRGPADDARERNRRGPADEAETEWRQNR